MMRAWLFSCVVIACGCTKGTFVTVKVDGAVDLPPITRLELDLDLDGRSAHTVFNAPAGGTIALPTDGVLEIGSGFGHLSLHVDAYGPAGLVARGDGEIDVFLDKRVTLAITLGDSTGPGSDGGSPPDLNVPPGSDLRASTDLYLPPDLRGPTIGCVGSSALFCEDFEALTTGTAVSARWSTVGNGALTIDTTAGHTRGAKALKVHTTGAGIAFLRLGFTPPNNSFFGRMWMYATAFPSAPDFAHFTLVEATGMDLPTLVRPIGGQYVPPGLGTGTGRALWGPGSNGGASGDWLNWKGTAPAEAGKWVCVEWQIQKTDNRMDVWVDGVAKPELTTTTTQHSGTGSFVLPTINTIFVGWQLYQPNPTPAQYDIWLDDLVLDTQRPGC